MAFATFLLVLAAPVTVPLSFDDIAATAFKTVSAGNHGGGNGGGNGGENGGGNGSGNANGGNKGGNDKGGTGRASGAGDGSDRAPRIAEEPSVILAVFTTTIRKRRPADELTILDNRHQAVSFYTELGAMAGATVKHEWYFRGALKYSASFDVLADRWRIWSTQLLPPEMAGQWTVKLVTGDGAVLDSRELVYRPAA